MSLSSNFKIVFDIINSDIDSLQGSIPLSTSQLANDSGFVTSAYVDAEVSGKQDAITSSNKLDYALLSGTPTIPTKTSDLNNDSNFATETYVDEQISGKLDAPSGGISGQVLTKTSDGVEWADAQGGAVTWGSISGTLSAQTDLQNELDNFTELDIVLQDYIRERMMESPLYIETIEDGNVISLSSVGETTPIVMKYSFDNAEWRDYTVGDLITLRNAGDTVFFKGNNSYFSSGASSYYKLTSLKTFNVGGNILSLLAENLEVAWIPSYAFYCLFGETNVVDASKLILTMTGSNSYQRAFYRCSFLLKAPELLATTLDYYCYHSMFYECSNLSKINVAFTDWATVYNATTDWVNNVSPSGTFYCPADLNTSTKDSSHVPTGWTVIK